MKHIALLVLVVALGALVVVGVRNTTPAVSPTMPNEVSDTPAEQTTLSATDPKSRISFTYPTRTEFPYVTLSDWPPRFVNSIDPIQCELDEQTVAMSGATSRTETVNSTTYCIWETTEAAAGSVYRTYQVIYPQDGQYLTMSFTAQYPQCENFAADEVAVCKAAQAQFLPLTLIDKVAQSAQLP